MLGWLASYRFCLHADSARIHMHIFSCWLFRDPFPGFFSYLVTLGYIGTTSVMIMIDHGFGCYLLVPSYHLILSLLQNPILLALPQTSAQSDPRRVASSSTSSAGNSYAHEAGGWPPTTSSLSPASVGSYAVAPGLFGTAHCSPISLGVQGDSGNQFQKQGDKAAFVYKS